LKGSCYGKIDRNISTNFVTAILIPCLFDKRNCLQAQSHDLIWRTSPILCFLVCCTYTNYNRTGETVILQCIQNSIIQYNMYTS